jgi:hypothetical protein
VLSQNNALFGSAHQGRGSDIASNNRAALVKWKSRALVIPDDAVPSKTFIAITGGRIIAAPNPSNFQSSIASHGWRVQISFLF